MSNLNLKKKWIKWYPQEIFFKNNNSNKKVLVHTDLMKKEDFCIQINHQDSNNTKSDCKIDIIEKKIYEEGFKKGFEKGQLSHNLSIDKLNNLFLSFKNNLYNFENELYSELLKIILKISSYVIGKNIHFDESILMNYIKKIINEHSSFLKNPRLIVHPDNKMLIENTFKHVLNKYKWILEYDNSIDLNGCKVISENGDLDATIDARWQELYRLIFSEDY